MNKPSGTSSFVMAYARELNVFNYRRTGELEA
jgi:hypothetical protein